MVEVKILPIEKKFLFSFLNKLSLIEGFQKLNLLAINFQEFRFCTFNQTFSKTIPDKLQPWKELARKGSCCMNLKIFNFWRSFYVLSVQFLFFDFNIKIRQEKCLHFSPLINHISLNKSWIDIILFNCIFKLLYLSWNLNQPIINLICILK